jgi:hypothetical protein
MKPRHAAALALVGWYLIMPPQDDEHYRLHASLSEWQQIGAYESATECERQLAMDQLFAPRDQWNANQRKAMDSARCISSDDPRLKAK